MKFTLLSGLCALLMVFGAHAQNYDLVLSTDAPPEVKVTGTSTLHDWTVQSNEIPQVPKTLTFNPTADQILEAFSFQVEVAQLDGGRGASMNEKIKSAFKWESNPHIKFQQTQASSQEVSDSELEITSQGILSMAGMEREVSVKVKAVKKDQNWHFSGQYPMNMSDFNMERPSAMFCQIKTHDPVIVHFSFHYQIKEP